ncbi:TauD/TfdA dioxygenase family protein [Aspergillus affinis]|uniref:TauD/TfdA dioxygenase family protein n=1 Tax=Aspergillus affinis TaxID=1070780 RepID=UPI0022FEDA91|nr:taurine dioxygenase [Aspergillus affinis]KAI9036937.1 taurine dioxygenase [Aspergillus affinis]
MAPSLTVNGQPVEAYSDTKPTTIQYEATPELPAVYQRALPPRPLGDHIPPRGIREPVNVPRDRGLSADPNLPHLLANVKRTDLTPSLGTLLTGIQLSALTDEQKDELALLVAHRGVVFFRDQDITAEQQRELFDYYGIPELLPDPEDEKAAGRPIVNGIEEQEEDYRGVYVHFKWPFADFHADSSFQANPPSFSLLRIDELPPTGGDTAWISGYGTYETLSEPLQHFADGLKAWHSSEHVYDSVLNHWGRSPQERPVETLHPVVTTHPVTGYKVLNLNSGFVTRIDGLKRYESDKILELLFTHIHTAQDHTVRFRWEKNSVALWDNRTTTHRATHDYAPLHRHGVRVTIKGQIPRHVPESESRKKAVVKALKEGKVYAVHDENTRKGNYHERGFPKV